MKLDPSVRKWFIIGNVLLVLCIAGAVYKDTNREWKQYQREFARLEVERLERAAAQAQDEAAKAALLAEARAKRSVGYEVKQVVVGDLNKIDRCITCHVGMDPLANPSLQTPYDKHPFKGHPYPEMMAAHPVSKFGCTTCHGGQGLATTMVAAHGKVKHWEEPLLEPPFIQGSCVKCHANFESLPYTQTAAQGKQLINKLGCYGCHTIKGFGGVIGDDLSEIANKPLSRIDFSNTGLPPRERNTKNWIMVHLTMDPAKVTPGDPLNHLGGGPIAPSGMQPFYKVINEAQAASIASYLMSMTSEKIPSHYYVYEPPKPAPQFGSAVERGKYVYHKYGCQACHGIEAKEGWRNFNALGPGQDASAEGEALIEEMLKGREPDLRATVGTFTRDELRAKIAKGVQPNEIVKFKENGPTPPLYMPSWQDKIKGQEMEDLLTYLFSIAQKSEEW